MTVPQCSVFTGDLPRQIHTFNTIFLLMWDEPHLYVSYNKQQHMKIEHVFAYINSMCGLISYSCVIWLFLILLILSSVDLSWRLTKSQCHCKTSRRRCIIFRCRSSISTSVCRAYGLIWHASGTSWHYWNSILRIRVSLSVSLSNLTTPSSHCPMSLATLNDHIVTTRRTCVVVWHASGASRHYRNCLVHIWV